MVKKILIAAALLVIGFLIYASLQPDDYKVVRSITIDAQPEAIYPHLADHRKANVWSPWLKKDSAATLAYSGPETGANSKFSWAGNSEIGSGSSTIIQTRTNEYVQIKLEFLKPMKGDAESEYILKSLGTQTEVTWTMAGKKSFISKVMCVFMSMDKMVGETFEKGLLDLKSLVEQK